jgi:hypothetical protein
VANGVTLCYRCHWAVHTAPNENSVNSGNTLTGNAEGNPEPSPCGNVREGVTTRGRAYRRWVGTCDWCSKPISKRLSDTTGRKRLYCSKLCSGKGAWFYRHGSNPSKSAGRESDDIV